jgi:hypothetical protein
VSINKYKPHIYVLPEDDATRQIAVGFYQQVPDQRLIQILPFAGGWSHVLESFLLEYQPTMQTYSHRYVILVIDFDKDTERLVVRWNDSAEPSPKLVKSVNRATPKYAM